VEPASPTAAGPGSGAGRGGASQYTQAVNEAISRVAQAFNTAQIQKTVWGDFIDVNEEVSDSMKSAFEQLSEFTGPDGPFNPDSPGIQRFLQTMEQEFPDAFAAFSGAVQGVTQNVEDQSDLLQEQLTAGSGGGGAAAGAGPGADLMAGFRQTLTDAGNYVSENLNGFAGELATAAMQAGAYGVAMVAVNTVMAGFFEQMNPILNDVLAPLQDALTQMGRILASTLIPIMNRLAPVFEVIGNVILANFASMIELITPGLEILGAVLAILTPIIQTAATVFEILTAPLRFLADLLEYVGKVIRHAIGEITFWTSRDNTSAPGSFRSDAFSGLEDRIRRIWDVDTPDYADGVPGDSSASSSTGDNTRVSRPPDIHIYQTFQGPVIGEAGKAQVGEFMAEAMIAYAGIGGRIIFEDAEGNQFTLAAEG
jgi:hypothetical protein